MEELHQGQHALRVKGTEKCIHHQEMLTLICLDCQELACTGCVTSLHRRHDFCNLKDKFPEASEEIRTFIDRIEKREFSEIDEAIISARSILKKDSDHFDYLEYEVKQHLEKLKEDLELLTAKILSSYQQLRKKNTDVVADYIKELGIRREKFNKLLNECRTVLQSGSQVYMYDLRNEIHDLKPLPKKPSLGSASFTPNKQPFDLLKKSFGTVATHDGQVYQGEQTGHKWPSSTKPKYKLMSSTEVINEVSKKYDIKSISATNNRGAYVCTWYGKKVTLLNPMGKVLQEIEYNVRVSDVRVSPTTQHIWTCSDEDCSVMECIPSDKPYKPVVRFNTDNKPICLCVTVDNCILIGMSAQITKYTAQGKMLLTTKPSKSGQPVVRTPERITECSVTHNVAVVERDYKDDGGGDKPHVLVIDKNSQEMFRFKGDIPTEYKQSVKRRQLTFHPSDVRYDSVGNIVIGDYNRFCVHLLSGGGDFLKLIYTGDTGVWSVGIDINNLLWVVTVDKIKLLQYCNTYV